jgi:glycosyltransferase involved in cell wall biosynthesis
MYVCAFRGRRDSYQVPTALAEGGMLDTLITDAYMKTRLKPLAGLLPGRYAEKALRRRAPKVPDHRVQCLWGTTLREWARHLVGKQAAKTYAALDPVFSRAAAARARTSGGDLLLYTPYAWEAFRQSYSHRPKRVLFQYHPHAPYERQLLKEDVEEHPEVEHSYRQETRSELPVEARTRVDQAWEHADVILCASSFTQRTLVEAGADPERCRVIPYGIDPENTNSPSSLPGTFDVLFVGSGVQRKGLHHLLRAWGTATLPADSSLTLVCRTIDPGLETLAESTARVRLLHGVSEARLRELYRSSTLFAMPSLIEGFGQVYLEALRYGCPVLGTPNTACPDLGDESDGIYTVSLGAIDELVGVLERLSTELPGSVDIPERARSCAEEFTWPRFRRQLRRVLDTP